MDMTTQHLVVYPNQAALKAMLWQQVALVGVNLLVLIVGMVLDLAVGVFLVAGAGLLVFGVNALYVAWRCVVRRPLVEIGPAGIVDHGSGAGAGLIRWDEIEALYPFTFLGQLSLGIVLRAEERVLGRQGRIKRLMMRLNKRLVGVPVSMLQAVLPIPVNELAERISAQYNIPIRSRP